MSCTVSSRLPELQSKALSQENRRDKCARRQAVLDWYPAGCQSRMQYCLKEPERKPEASPALILHQEGQPRSMEGFQCASLT